MSTHTTSTIERPALTPSALADRTPASYCTRQHSSALALADRIARDPSTSYWLAQNLRVMLRSFDRVDAVSDAVLLLSVVAARLEEIQGGAK